MLPMLDCCLKVMVIPEVRILERTFVHLLSCEPFVPTLGMSVRHYQAEGSAKLVRLPEFNVGFTFVVPRACYVIQEFLSGYALYMGFFVWIFDGFVGQILM